MPPKLMDDIPEYRDFGTVTYTICYPPKDGTARSKSAFALIHALSQCTHDYSSSRQLLPSVAFLKRTTTSVADLLTATLDDHKYTSKERFSNPRCPGYLHAGDVPHCSHVKITPVGYSGVGRTGFDIAGETMEWSLATAIGTLLEVDFSCAREYRSRVWSIWGQHMDTTVAALIFTALLQSCYRIPSGEIINRKADAIVQRVIEACSSACAALTRYYARKISNIVAADVVNDTSTKEYNLGRKLRLKFTIEGGTNGVGSDESDTMEVDTESDVVIPTASSSNISPSTGTCSATDRLLSLSPNPPPQKPKTSKMKSSPPLSKPRASTSKTLPPSSATVSPGNKVTEGAAKEVEDVEDPNEDPMRKSEFVNSTALDKGYEAFLLECGSSQSTISRKKCIEINLNGGMEGIRQQYLELTEGGDGDEPNVLYFDSRKARDVEHPMIRILTTACEGDTPEERKMAQLTRVEQDASNPDGGCLQALFEYMMKNSIAVIFYLYMLQPHLLNRFCSDEMIDSFWIHEGAAVTIILPELKISTTHPLLVEVQAKLKAKLLRRNIKFQKEFFTWVFVKETYPATHHTKLVIGISRTKELIFVMDGSGNFSKYGTGSDFYFLTSTGNLRSKPNMSTESILFSTIPLESDCWRSWLKEIERKNLRMLLDDRLVDITTSTLTNSRSTPESEEVTYAQFESSFADKRTPEERDRERLQRQSASIRRPNAVSRLEKLTTSTLPTDSNEPIIIQNQHSRPSTVLPEDPPFPARFLDIQQDFERENKIMKGWKVGVYCYCCGKISLGYVHPSSKKDPSGVVVGAKGMIHHPTFDKGSAHCDQGSSDLKIGVQCFVVAHQNSDSVEVKSLGEVSKRLQFEKDLREQILSSLGLPNELLYSGGNNIIQAWYWSTSVTPVDPAGLTDTLKIAETIRDWTKRSCDALHPDWIGWSALKYETVCETLAQRKVFTADLAKSLGNEVWPVTTKEFAHSRAPNCPRPLILGLQSKVLEFSRQRILDRQAKGVGKRSAKHSRESRGKVISMELDVLAEVEDDAEEGEMNVAADKETIQSNNRSEEASLVEKSEGEDIEEDGGEEIAELMAQRAEDAEGLELPATYAL